MERIRADVQRAIALKPQLVSAVLQQMLDNSTFESENESQSSIGNPPSLVEITPSELEGLVSIRESHQTVQAATGVRTYKHPTVQKQRPNTRPNDIPKDLSQEQQLAHRINSIVHKAQDRGTSTGLNRKARWTGDTGPSVPSTMAGNTANAEVAAKGRASEVWFSILVHDLKKNSAC